MTAIEERRTTRPATLWRLLGALAACAAVLAPAGAATPDPTSVTIAGSLQTELGCPGDWQPDCAASHLAYDAGDDVWQGTFAVPAGDWEYKAALNNSWDESYGLNAGAANIPLPVAADRNVKFYYDHKTHWATDNVGSTIVVAPGSFQSELGCPGDWDPGCLRSWLQDPDGNGTYTFVTDVIPAGDYEAKAAINESWDVSYGAGGVAGNAGANIPFSVPAGGATVTFSYVDATHVLTITVVSLDTTDPIISGQRTPGANGYGWNNTDVVVSFTCNDNAGGSGVGTVTSPITLSANGAGQSATGTCTDTAGNSASTTVSGINIDKVAPTVTYGGNAGTYTVDQTVAITCTPFDGLSGIAASTCAAVAGPASSFGLGAHTHSATATDKAGNTGAGSTTFTVVATPTSLCRLTEQLVRDSAKYRNGGRVQRAAADWVTAGACGVLRAAASAPRAARVVLVGAYKVHVSALAAGGWLSQPQAATLRSFADALLP